MARPTTYGLITKSLLTDIGNAVRTKNGTTELRTPSQLASDILALPTGVSTLTKIVSGKALVYNYPYTTSYDSTKAYILIFFSTSGTTVECILNSTRELIYYTNIAVLNHYNVSISSTDNTITIYIANASASSGKITLYSLS